MSADLIQRWLDVVRPLDIDLVLSQMSEQYGKTLSWDEETKARALKALQSVDKAALMEQARMFAEENFSEEVLKGAVEFFESQIGRKYLEQRRVVTRGCEFMVTKSIAEGIKKEFGI